MREKIFIIEDHFQIKGRGVIITGKTEKKSTELRIGTPIIICRPDGKEIETKVGGIDIFNPPNFKNVAILVHNLTKDDLLIGSSVFIDLN